MLQNIDSIESIVPVIAATNHEHLLDSAVWRRFDYKLKINLPAREQRNYLINGYLESVKIDNKSKNMLTVMTEGF